MTSCGVLKESAASSGISIPNSSSTAITTSTTSNESNPKSLVKDEDGLKVGAEVATLSNDLRTLKIRSWTWSIVSESTAELNARRLRREFELLERLEMSEMERGRAIEMENGLIKREIVNPKVI